jgi:hypothetical protein
MNISLTIKRVRLIHSFATTQEAQNSRLLKAEMPAVVAVGFVVLVSVAVVAPVVAVAAAALAVA